MTQPSDTPSHRYTAAMAQTIETAWQERWDREGTFVQPNPGQRGFDPARPKFYCLDMFPYPSGAGLHVGHPEGYTATDIVCRYKRMTGFNVLHPMGWDAFGLPAEQYAIQTGVHPAITTRKAIDNFRRQLKRFGFSYDWSREFGTIDPGYYKWTQWIFLRLYGAWFDPRAKRARPIAELIAELERGVHGITPSGDLVATGGELPGILGGEPVGVRMWHELSQADRRAFIDSHRLAYIGQSMVNWCPKLGTVLANDEVIDGRSERGGFPVLRKPLRQWMFRITAYADRLLDQLDALDWPASTRAQQAEWIGRSEGAEIGFEILGSSALRAEPNPATAGAPDSSPGASRALLERLDEARRRPLQPLGFLARDPYPQGTYGRAKEVIETRRLLPHLQIPGATYFVTWKAMDGVSLSEDEMALALRSLVFHDGTRCRTYAATVMNNHVHWIVRPFEDQDLQSLVTSVKRFSAREINEGRAHQGSIWHGEQFDHIIRDSEYFTEFLLYVADNPVEAGLARIPAEYPFTFVHPDVFSDQFATSFGSEFGSESRTTQELTVFTTRPDTIFGATYMVVAPEHPLVGTALACSGSDALRDYVRAAANRSDLERMESKAKTGVDTGLRAINPATGQEIPIWTADYVLMGYGTGAIMAVPAQDERDWEFAKTFGLPIIRTVRPPDGFGDKPYTGDGPAIASGFLDGLHIAQAKERIIAWLEEKGIGRRRVNYKLRDWTFSRQRYWGEPFPIVFTEDGTPYPVSDAALPVALPELADYAPIESDDPQPLLAKAADWCNTTAGAAGVDPALLPPETPVRRETNTMPGSAGSSWYAVRYCDPRNGERFVGAEAEAYWMKTQPPHIGGVDLYLGGSEHAVGHLLYSRFWHNVLFDLGYLSTPEPFQKLFHQGLITSFAYQRADKSLVAVDQVEERGEGKFFEIATGGPVTQVVAKMSKSLKNVINPDEVISEFGADTMRLYEMYMGPLDASKPWNPRDIVGQYKFLQRAWRTIIDEGTGQPRLAATADPAVERELHRTIARVGPQIEKLAFNTAIADLIKFINAVPASESAGALTRPQAERFALILAPFAPHMAEELWSRLGNTASLACAPWPTFDPAQLQDSTIEIPVQILGKLRSRITVPAGSDNKALESAALADPRIKELIEGKKIAKVIVIPGKLVNIVAN